LVAKFHPFAKDIFKKENSVSDSLFFLNCQKSDNFFLPKITMIAHKHERVLKILYGILPNLAKYIYRLSPFEQHEKIEKKKKKRCCFHHLACTLYPTQTTC
jgi:hypothetical protein